MNYFQLIQKEHELYWRKREAKKNEAIELIRKSQADKKNTSEKIKPARSSSTSITMQTSLDDSPTKIQKFNP